MSLQAYMIQQELDRRAGLVSRADGGRLSTKAVRRRRWSGARLRALTIRLARPRLRSTLEPET